ncbi:MAG: hypothetical protein WC919_08365 [Candidatus Paceibacterota bacterium]
MASTLTDTRATLEHSYVQWLCSHRQIEFITRFAVMPDGTVRARKEYMNARDTREMLSILERWHISMQSDANESTEKMQSELVEKGLAVDDTHAQIIVSHIVNTCERIDRQDRDVDGVLPRVMINACMHGNVQRDRDTSVSSRSLARCSERIDIGFVCFARFSRKFSPERLTMMATIAASRIGCETNDPRVIDCIATAALCYDALVPRGQQLSIPPRAYDVMIQKYGATFEGFASPFNSQMMRYMMPGARVDTLSSIRAYCSIFPHIDAPFGSVGSFFDESVPANGLSNRVSVLNPPFIEKMMVSMVKKCIADLARATEPTRIFIVIPNWTDSPYFAMLTTCPYIERQLALPANHHYIDAMRADLPISMRISQFLFVLSRNCHDTREHMYEDIIEAFQYSE